MPLGKGVNSPLKLKQKKIEEFQMPPTVESVGANIDDLEQDRAIFTDPEETRRRRTLKLTKENSSWGFTLQTYGIKHKKTNEIEIMTYVDYVDYNSPAWFAGLQRGDVILSVNGTNVEHLKHKELVSVIKHSGSTLRLVVLFENCTHRVELHERYIKLKKLLEGKIKEMKMLDDLEHKFFEERGINRLDLWRQSLRSNCSSQSSWDKYSFIESPDNYRTYSTSSTSLNARDSLQSSSSLSFSKLDYPTHFIPHTCDESISYCDEDVVDISCTSSEDDDEQILTPEFTNSKKVHFDWSFSSTDESEKSEKTLKLLGQESSISLPDASLGKIENKDKSTENWTRTKNDINDSKETDDSFSDIEIQGIETSDFVSLCPLNIPNIYITDYDEETKSIPKEISHTSNDSNREIEFESGDESVIEKFEIEDDLVNDVPVNDITQEPPGDEVSVSDNKLDTDSCDQSDILEHDGEVLNKSLGLNNGAKNDQNTSEEKCDENCNVYPETTQGLSDSENSNVDNICPPMNPNVYISTCNGNVSKRFIYLVNETDEDTWL